MIRPLRRPLDYNCKPVYGTTFWVSRDERFVFFRWTSNPSSPFHSPRPDGAPTVWWTVAVGEKGDPYLLSRWNITGQWFERLQDAIDALEASLALESET